MPKVPRIQDENEMKNGVFLTRGPIKEAYIQNQIGTFNSFED
jgi:hypothetical protein